MNDIDAVCFDLDGTLCRHAGDMSAAYRRAFERAGVELFGETTALWAALDAATVRGPSGIVTNGPRSRQFQKVQALGLDERVDVVVYAGDLPRRKPHAAPFREALTALGVPAPRTLYVGDSLAYDVAGAQNAGLRVAWIRGEGKNDDPSPYRPEYVLDDIGELVGLLEGQ